MISNQIPATLLRSLEALPKESAACLLVRHGDRLSAAIGQNDRDVRLEPEGIERAKHLGRCLGDRLLGVWSSPLVRCLDTVQAMLAGAEVNLVAQTSAVLGHPGAYVKNSKLCGAEMASRGTRAVLSDLMSGRAVPGMRSLGEGSLLLGRHLHSLLPKRTGCVVHVSHDAIVLPFLHLVTGEAVPIQGGWLDFLEGGLLVGGPGEPVLIWDGVTYPFPSEMCGSPTDTVCDKSFPC